MMWALGLVAVLAVLAALVAWTGLGQDVPRSRR